jgi:Transposase DDE domain
MSSCTLFVSNQQEGKDMSIEDFIITVFCIIDDELEKLLNGKKLRHRGRHPTLADSEVITMEIVGEFLGKDCDKSIWEYFKSHWSHFFPGIPDRSNFARQAANLHVIKRMLQENFAMTLGSLTDSLHIIDGLPMPVCQFARAYFSKIFKGEAAYGYCATKKAHYYGFRGHLVINSIGVITAATFTAANIDERDVCPEMVESIQGILLGDKGYIRPKLQRELDTKGLYLETPLRGNMEDLRPSNFLNWMKGTRRLIETVIGQLSERFHIEKVRARDLWHEAARFWRKLLAHTICIKVCVDTGGEPLQFEQLIAS